jgi:DNA-binding transcriptional ArsR family regulator
MNSEYPPRFKEIVRHAKRVPSTISYHLKRLTNARIVMVDQNRLYRYRLINKARILRILSQYERLNSSSKRPSVCINFVLYGLQN